jgi:hypothetical protein
MHLTPACSGSEATQKILKTKKSFSWWKILNAAKTYFTNNALF